MFYIVQQAEEMIENIFSSFKSKLRELNWTNMTALQSVMKKVTYEAMIDALLFFFNIL